MADEHIDLMADVVYPRIPKFIEGDISTEDYMLKNEKFQKAFRTMYMEGKANVYTSYVQISIPVHEHVKTVAKFGGDFETIQGAIDNITDATASKRYTLLVYPGEYTEDITCKSYISIVGMGGWKDVKIIGTTTISDTTEITFQNLYFYDSVTTGNAYGIYSDSGSGNFHFINCYIHTIKTSNDETNCTTLKLYSEVVTFRHCQITSDWDNAPGGGLPNYPKCIDSEDTISNLSIYDSVLTVKDSDSPRCITGATVKIYSSLLTGSSSVMIAGVILFNACTVHCFNCILTHPNAAADYDFKSSTVYLYGTDYKKSEDSTIYVRPKLHDGDKLYISHSTESYFVFESSKVCLYVNGSKVRDWG